MALSEGRGFAEDDGRQGGQRWHTCHEEASCLQVMAYFRQEANRITMKQGQVKIIKEGQLRRPREIK